MLSRGSAGFARRRWKKSKYFAMTRLVSHLQNIFAPPLPLKWPLRPFMRGKAPEAVVMPT